MDSDFCGIHKLISKFWDLADIIFQFIVKMGSAPSVKQKEPQVPQVIQNPAEILAQIKTDNILKQIDEKNKTVPLNLKVSQSVNLLKSKNETKVKKVRDIRSYQTLKDIKTNNENEEHWHQVQLVKKPQLRQLNPVNKKKLASDRALISQQSKTQNVVAMEPITTNGLAERNFEYQSRTRKCRVSKML